MMENHIENGMENEPETGFTKLRGVPKVGVSFKRIIGDF